MAFYRPVIMLALLLGLLGWILFLSGVASAQAVRV